MIAVDTNILIHAHRSDSPSHGAALRALAGLESRRWAIPWSCLHEFLAITTHPRVFDPPTPPGDARKAVTLWLSASAVSVLTELDGYWEVLDDLLANSSVVGPRIHDARIAAVCIQHAVDELWTADRDFSRFPRLETRNPLIRK